MLKLSTALQLILLNVFTLQAHYILRSLLVFSPGETNNETMTTTGAAPSDYPIVVQEQSSSSPFAGEILMNTIPRGAPTLQEFLLGDDNDEDDTKLRRKCDEDGLHFMENRVWSTTATESNNTETAESTRYEISKTVHVTGRTRCLAKPFYNNLHRWHFTNYSFVFHDDQAVNRFLHQRDWPEFPHLKTAMNCLISGAGKADLWRYLLLWEYGGIYTDMDTGPGPKFSTRLSAQAGGGHTPLILDGHDAYFVVEDAGVLSQYFMAVSPRHPLMYFAVLHTLRRLMEVANVKDQYVPFVTGPGALKAAFITFMGTDGTKIYNKVQEGRYTGVGNRTVTVVGSRKTSNRYIKRYSITQTDKKEGYAKMGMVHFSKAKEEDNNPALNVSCFAHLYDIELRNERYLQKASSIR